MISKVEAYNTNQPKFKSKVRVSDKLVNSLSENGQNVLKKQIKILEKNGNDDLVVLNKGDHLEKDNIKLTVYKKVKKQIMENIAHGYAPYTLENKNGYKLVDLYNEATNEAARFWEAKVSKVLFE